MDAAAKNRLKRLLIIPPIAAGVIALALAIGGREKPLQVPPTEAARPVRVITLEAVDFVPRAVGYGPVEPAAVWQAVAQVSGKIAERHDDLHPGRLFDAGTVLLRIDPADYELAVAQFEATLESVKAELAELEMRESNTRLSLAIERQVLSLAEDDLARKRTLRRQGVASQAAVDEAERQVLLARQKLQDLENQLTLYPAQRQVLEASLALNEARLRGARLDLERTVLRLPFDARIAEVHVERNQFVNVGEVLAVADSIDAAEVTAQVPIGQMAVLARRDIDPSPLTAAEIGRIPDRFGLEASVLLRTEQVTARWDARVDRISPAIDPKTRTVGVIVSVDEPYRKAIPGRRPPLIKNMFVRVDLYGPAWPQQMVIPRVALHRTADGPRVYVAGDDDRLVLRPVSAGPVQGDLAVIESGLEPGERVVVSDLIPAIGGMLLQPAEDEAAIRELLVDARADDRGRERP